jgi:capsular polysaccharide biosynthesis protein
MEREVQLSDLWKIIRQHLGKIVLITVTFVLVTGLVSFFLIPPEYEATATILVQATQSEGNNPFNDVMANQKLVKTYSDIIKSRRLAEGVIQRLNLNTTPTELLKNVDVTSTPESLVTVITVRDGDPHQAVAIANAFAEVFADNINTIMKVDKVSIVDPATEDPNPKPVSPQPFLYMGLAMAGGLLFGVGLAFLLEYMDQTIKDEEEIERLLGIPVLGVITRFDQAKK